MRERLSLDGQWDFQFHPGTGFSPAPEGSWRSVTVPGPWQASLADLRLQTGMAWYRRAFDAPAARTPSAVILHFGAVDYWAEVWLNGVPLGEHEGGYLPFEFDVGPHLRAGGSNELLVRVIDPSGDAEGYPRFPFDQIPHGKQSWYGPLSGIWQPVWIEWRSPWHVRALRLAPDLRSGCVRAALSFSAPVSEGCALRIKLVDAAGAEVARSEQRLAEGSSAAELEAVVANPRAWCPEDPVLYSLHAELLQDQRLLDAVSEHFGFRTIEARDGRLLLNGQPIYLRGALDQDYYPDTMSTPPSEAFLADELRKAKELGLNCLRCHIKIADPRYMAVADRLGVLVWAELPSWRVFSEATAARAETTLRGLVQRDGNHPSIIAWTIVNESWGLDLLNDANHRRWLKRTYRWLKRLDPGRLVIDNSACWPNFHLQTDVEDYHQYKAMPDRRRDWDKFVAEFARRPPWAFHQGGEAVRRGDEPLVISEFGNWGLPDANLLRDAEGRDPWWFETGHEFGTGVVHPQGVRERFRTWGLDRVFGGWQAFVEATQWQQFAALKYQIEAMRRQAAIAGYVITEFTDVHWECNGLLDMQRNPKAFYTALAAVNADTVVIPAWQRAAFWAGEPVHVGLVVAHGSGEVLDGAEVCWSLSPDGPGGRVAVPRVEAGQAVEIGSATFPAPTVRQPGAVRLQLELRSREGLRVASNYLDLHIFPRRDGAAVPGSALWSPNPDLAQRLAALGYKLARDAQAAQAVVTHSLDEALASYLRRGGRLLVLANRPEALGQHLQGVQAAARQGTAWQGDWASSFCWLRREGPLACLPGGPMLDFPFERVIPEHVLTGFGPADFQARVHAGMFVGWIHKPVALLAERCDGQGRAVLTTFEVTADAPQADPVATTVLDALIELTLRPSPSAAFA